MHKLPLVAALCLLASQVHADEVHGTRSEKLVEQRHEATLVVNPGWASLQVRRTVYNGGDRHDQAVFSIEVPDGAVATGLRTLGTLHGVPHWFAGELMEAEAAASKYRELTGIGGFYPKDPALLSWRSQDHLALQVFPVAPGGPKTIEYTLMLPTEYRGGAHHVVLPPMGTAQLRAALRERPAPGGKLRKSAVTPDQTDVALEIRDAPTIGGALAVVPFAEERILTRYRVEAAPRLSAVPRDARVVVLLDASRSVDDAQRAAQLAAARAYLSHFVDGRAEVLVFDREVRPRHGRFVGMREALRDLATLQLQGRNGSEVENALLAADELLAKQGARHPKRILLLTDTLTKEALTPQRLAAIERSGALIHVAIAHEGDAAVARDDDHDWAAFTRPSGGLVWNAWVTAKGDNGTALEELVRPIRVHHLSLTAPRMAASVFEHEDTLSEGEGITSAWIADSQIPWLTVHGELWTKPIRKRLEPDAEEARRWSAFVFGSDLLHELTEDEMMTLAKRGGAVSPVTSYLAIEPGVRPSTEGLDEAEAMGSGMGTGIGQGFGAGHGRLANTDVAVAFLQSELGAHWKRCGGKRSTRLTIETTLREIVEVASQVDSQVPDEAPAVKCLRQATWELTLPASFEPFRWHRWNVSI